MGAPWAATKRLVSVNRRSDGFGIDDAAVRE